MTRGSKMEDENAALLVLRPCLLSDPTSSRTTQGILFIAGIDEWRDLESVTLFMIRDPLPSRFIKQMHVCFRSHHLASAPCLTVKLPVLPIQLFGRDTEDVTAAEGCVRCLGKEGVIRTICCCRREGDRGEEFVRSETIPVISLNPGRYDGGGGGGVVPAGLLVPLQKSGQQMKLASERCHIGVRIG